MPAQPKIRERVLLSTCGDGDYVRLPAPVDRWVHLGRVKAIPGGRLQVKYRQSLVHGNVAKADVKGDPAVERERAPETEADFAILAEMKEREARMRCQRYGMRPDDLIEEGAAKWTLFTDEAIAERERRAAEKRREEEKARRAEIVELMPLGMDEMMEAYASMGITSGPALDVVRRMLESSPAFGSATLDMLSGPGGILKRVG